LDEMLVMELRLDDPALDMVPVREPCIDRPPMDIRASARSNTPPLKALANEALCGVATVACTAGPSAADWGVMGS
jgi:hypothetical protein